MVRLDAIDTPGPPPRQQAPLPRGGGIAVAIAFLVVAIGVIVDQRAARDRRRPAHDRGPGAVRRSSSAARWRRSSASSTTTSSCAPGGSCWASSRWRCSRSRPGSRSPTSTTRSAAGNILLEGPFAIGFTMVWIIGMINSINFIDGLDGLSSGIALIAALTLGLISLHGHQPAVHRRAVLRAGGGAARVPALELPPGDDLHRHERRDVRRLHAGGARRSSARPRSRSRCSSWASRSSTRSGSSSGGWSTAARRSRRTAATSTTGCSTWACRMARRCS